MTQQATRERYPKPANDAFAFAFGLIAFLLVLCPAFFGSGATFALAGDKRLGFEFMLADGAGFLAGLILNHVYDRRNARAHRRLDELLGPVGSGSLSSDLT
jgi:hypothetical protein